MQGLRFLHVPHYAVSLSTKLCYKPSLLWELQSLYKFNFCTQINLTDRLKRLLTEREFFLFFQVSIRL